MVVARHHQHAAVRRAAVGVAVLDRIAGAVDAGALAVPQREHAVDGALGSDSTRCVPSTCVAASSSLIAGTKRTPACASLGPAFQAAWSPAQRRAAVAADEALVCSPAKGIARAASEQPHQRLRAGDEHAAGLGPQVVVQFVVRGAPAARPGRQRRSWAALAGVAVGGELTRADPNDVPLFTCG